MTAPDLQKLVQEIVAQAQKLKDVRTDAKDAPVNYACVFAQSDEEYSRLLEVAKKLGLVLNETKMGPLFQIKPLDTAAGKLQLLKIRRPDVNRPERGDADFTVADYPAFKEKYLSQPGYKLLLRERFEMIELADPNFSVLAYFSYPPLDQQYHLV
ncbi:MAG: hypothetical protein WC497_03000 [Patescibacteria group bacterium]